MFLYPRWAQLFTLGGTWILSTTITANADIKITRGDEIFVTIGGTITDSDAKEFQKLSQEFEYKPFTVHLGSMGGDVSAAMQIGRLIRRYRRNNMGRADRAMANVQPERSIAREVLQQLCFDFYCGCSPS